MAVLSFFATSAWFFSKNLNLDYQDAVQFFCTMGFVAVMHNKLALLQGATGSCQL